MIYGITSKLYYSPQISGEPWKYLKMNEHTWYGNVIFPQLASLSRWTCPLSGFEVLAAKKIMFLLEHFPGINSSSTLFVWKAEVFSRGFNVETYLSMAPSLKTGNLRIRFRRSVWTYYASRMRSMPSLEGAALCCAWDTTPVNPT